MMDSRLHYVIFMMVLIGEYVAEDKENFDGSCFCAMFRTEDDPTKEDPLLVSDPQIPIPHNIAGAKSCLRICITLYAASRDVIGKALCQVLKHDTDNLRVTVYFRLCDEEKWASTRNADKNRVCCRGDEAVECS
ncbi:uncharacterized protein LOC142326154 [Lycorma delicatula]|uniref:uncharacterized protein LOC142326154 n=1 Tax=Lycorma delicatula TaxID=130591 RepID=UPI003F510492